MPHSLFTCSPARVPCCFIVSPTNRVWMGPLCVPESQCPTSSALSQSGAALPAGTAAPHLVYMGYLCVWVSQSLARYALSSDEAALQAAVPCTSALSLPGQSCVWVPWHMLAPHTPGDAAPHEHTGVLHCLCTCTGQGSPAGSYSSIFLALHSQGMGATCVHAVQGVWEAAPCCAGLISLRIEGPLYDAMVPSCYSAAPSPCR